MSGTVAAMSEGNSDHPLVGGQLFDKIKIPKSGSSGVFNAKLHVVRKTGTCNTSREDGQLEADSFFGSGPLGVNDVVSGPRPHATRSSHVDIPKGPRSNIVQHGSLDRGQGQVHVNTIRQLNRRVRTKPERGHGL